MACLCVQIRSGLECIAAEWCALVTPLLSSLGINPASESGGDFVFVFVRVRFKSNQGISTLYYCLSMSAFQRSFHAFLYSMKLLWVASTTFVKHYRQTHFRSLRMVWSRDVFGILAETLLVGFLVCVKFDDTGGWERRRGVWRIRENCLKGVGMETERRLLRNIFWGIFVMDFLGDNFLVNFFKKYLLWIFFLGKCLDREDLEFFW